MKFNVLGLLLIAGLIMACSSDIKSIGDEEMGLRKIPVTDEKGIKLNAYEFSAVSAGESQKMERSYENAPPLIPHNIEGMTDITLSENMCLGCHIPEVATSVGATPIPKSHFYDLRNHKAIKDNISDSRYNCTQCHVPQANAKILIHNNFTPVFKNEKEKFESNLLDVIEEGVN